jgi:tryptophan synthase beta chain
MEQRAVLLNPDEIPTEWYNIEADLPEPLPPTLDPQTLRPISSPERAMRLFAKELVLQGASKERWIEIPEEVLEAFRWILRPTPLVRARHLEEYLNTPAKIYYKHEGLNPAGSYKTNTALAQAYYSKKDGVERLVTGTAAGQAGSACAMACAYFGLQATIYMDRLNYERKPGRRVMMQAWGAECIPSPSTRTKFGRSTLEANPEGPWSMEAVGGELMEDLLSDQKARLQVPTGSNFVLMHQTIIGLEAKKQLEMLDLKPDVMAACLGGGSNFAGLCFPFVADKIRNKEETVIVACKSKAVPRATRGKYTYDSPFGGALASPLQKVFTLGSKYKVPLTHTAGLGSPTTSPIVSYLLAKNHIRAIGFGEIEVFEAGSTFARTEGIIPAPEAAHAIRFVIDEARRCKQTGESKVIVFNLSGHGYLDSSAYEAYQSGRLEDVEPSEIDVPILVPG